MAKSSATILAMLLVLSATVAHIPAAAAEEPEPITDGQGDDGDSDNDVGENTEGCWSPVTRVEGCDKEVARSLIFGRLSENIDDACCSAVLEVPDECWWNMVTPNPLFRFNIKFTCAAKRDGRASAPARHAPASAPARHAGHAPASAPAKLSGHAPASAPAKLAGHAPAPAHAA